MLLAVILGAIGSLIAAGLIALGRWLRFPRNRERVWQPIREQFCRHEWKRTPPGFISPGGDQYCPKCNARRWS